jgi:hypothetical protein
LIVRISQLVPIAFFLRSDSIINAARVFIALEKYHTIGFCHGSGAGSSSTVSPALG